MDKIPYRSEEKPRTKKRRQAMSSLGTLVTVNSDGKTVKLPTLLSSNVELKSGQILSWRDCFYFEVWPKIPSIMEIKHGKARAIIERGANTQVPNYSVAIESASSDDLFLLLSACIKRLGGELLLVGPEATSYNLALSVQDAMVDTDEL